MKFSRLLTASYIGNPVHGSERVIKKFLWWPLGIQGETRWLETACIHQVYQIYHSISLFHDHYHEEWVNLKFVD